MDELQNILIEIERTSYLLSTESRRDVMAGDGSGKGSPEDRSKSSQRAADIAKVLERQAAEREAREKGVI